MPFKSKEQMKAAFGGYLGAEMKAKALNWAHETPNIKSLPEHVKKNIIKKSIKKHEGKGGLLKNLVSYADSYIIPSAVRAQDLKKEDSKIKQQNNINNEPTNFNPNTIKLNPSIQELNKESYKGISHQKDKIRYSITDPIIVKRRQKLLDTIFKKNRDITNKYGGDFEKVDNGGATKVNFKPENLPKVKKKKEILKKYVGKGGPIDTSYTQATSPINLLKARGEPPTVQPIKKAKDNSIGK